MLFCSGQYQTVQLTSPTCAGAWVWPLKVLQFSSSNHLVSDPLFAFKYSGFVDGSPSEIIPQLDISPQVPARLPAPMPSPIALASPNPQVPRRCFWETRGLRPMSLVPGPCQISLPLGFKPPGYPYQAYPRRPRPGQPAFYWASLLPDYWNFIIQW